MPAEKLSPTICSAESFAIRHPRRQDAARIERLVRESRVLDGNSRYAYLLLCEHFRETCLVAVRRGESLNPSDELAGFVAAYRPPTKPESIFVWQIGVSHSARQLGLGKRLLHNLIALPACEGLSFLEATVTPSNIASRNLFTAFAAEIGATVERSAGFSEADLSDWESGDCHEAEELYRIGPLPSQSHST